MTQPWLAGRVYDRLWSDTVNQTGFYARSHNCPIVETLFPRHSSVVDMLDTLKTQLRMNE